MMLCRKMTFKDYVETMYSSKLNDKTMKEIDILSRCVEEGDKQATNFMLVAIGYPRNVTYKRLLSNYQAVVQAETEVGIRSKTRS